MKKEQFCSKKCMFISCGIWECFSYSCRQCLGRFVKISLCMFIRTIWPISFLASLKVFHRFPFSSKGFQRFDDKISAGWSQLNFTCTLEHFEESCNFRKIHNFFYVVFGFWPANLWIFRENFLLASSKLHYPLLKNHFWWRK